MSFPRIKFGSCDRCGTSGGDQSASLTGADASARDTTGNGVELTEYDGMNLCRPCLRIVVGDQESLNAIPKRINEERFRGKAGFQTSI